MNELSANGRQQRIEKELQKNLKKFLTSSKRCDKVNELSKTTETLITKQ